MKKTKRVYLPKWQRWFLIPLFVLIWGMITYLKFYGTAPKDNLPMPAYIIMSVVFLGLGVMMWLMTSGTLPAYMIEEDEENQI